MMNKLCLATNGDFYKDAPSAVCVEGARIALLNEKARNATDPLSEGEVLYGYMPPEDVLKYETLYASFGEAGSLAFSLWDFHGYISAYAVFERVMGKRYGAVLFSEKSLDESADILKRIAQDKDEREGLVMLLHSVDDESLDDKTMTSLTDVREVFRQTVSRGRDCIASRIVVSQRDSIEAADAFFVPVPQRTLVQLILLLACAVDAVSKSRSIRVSLSVEKERTRISMTTTVADLSARVGDLEGLSAAFPEARELFSTFGFVAETGRASVSVATSEDMRGLCCTVSLDKTEYREGDFRSRASQISVKEDVDFVKAHVRALLRKCKGEGQE